MRWIAIALVAGMVATLAVGLVSGRGEPAGTEQDRAAGEDPVPTGTAAALDGPHVVLELCSGVACPRPDESAEQQLQQEAEQDPRVASARLVTSEQAYQLFLDQYGDDEELVEQVDPETVPARVELDLHRPDDSDAVMAEFEDREDVATAHDTRVPSNPP